MELTMDILNYTRFFSVLIQVSHCAKMPAELREQAQLDGALGFRHHGYGYNPGGGGGGKGGGEHRRFKSLDEIQCFKCGENGHFANKCPKGHLAFLSNKGGGAGPGKP